MAQKELSQAAVLLHPGDSVAVLKQPLQAGAELNLRGTLLKVRSSPLDILTTRVLPSTITTSPLIFSVVTVGAPIVFWVVVMYGFFTATVVREVKPSLETGINGAWLLGIVATQSVSVKPWLAIQPCSGLRYSAKRSPRQNCSRKERRMRCESSSKRDASARLSSARFSADARSKASAACVRKACS